MLHVITMFFYKQSLIKTNRCAGALSWRGDQLLVLDFSGPFRLTASLRRRRIVYIFLFTVGIPVKYTRESREVFEVTTARARLCVWWARYGSQYSYRLGGPRIESLRNGRDFPCRPDRRRGLVITGCFPWVKLAASGADDAYCVPNCE
jgi:hypothetical protein